MKVKAIKESSTSLRLVIVDGPIEDGKLSLRAKFSKGYDEIASCDYLHEKINYTLSVLDTSTFSIDISSIEVVINDTHRASVPNIFGAVPNILNGIINKKRADFIAVARHLNGSKVYLFKRLKSGEHCKTCWDEDLRSSSNSACPECGGTGFSKYYSNPLLTWGGAWQTTNTLSPVQYEGRTNSYQNSTLEVLADYEPTTGDILYYVKFGTWLIISDSISPMLMGIPVKTIVTVQEAEEDSPEVRLLSLQIPLNNKGKKSD